MVLLSFKFHMNFYLFNFLPIVNNSVLFTSYFYLSCCVFALLHSSIACHKLFGINLRERKGEILTDKAFA